MLVRAAVLALLSSTLLACDVEPIDWGEIEVDPPVDAPEPGGPRQALGVLGSVTGTSAAQEARAVILWQVTSGNGDYEYVTGEGAAVDGSFLVHASAPPPAEAINAHGVGVGLVVLVSKDAPPPRGRIDGDQLTVLGLSPQHAIIWKGAGPGLPWSQAFPDGYACGRCVPASGEARFDGFAPVACGEVEVVTSSTPDELEVCEWT